MSVSYNADSIINHLQRIGKAYNVRKKQIVVRGQVGIRVLGKLDYLRRLGYTITYE
jgi:hypothetical protein